MIHTPDLALTQAALASSTLSHGLRVFGDRWTVQVMLSAFLGICDDIQPTDLLFFHSFLHFFSHIFVEMLDF